MVTAAPPFISRENPARVRELVGRVGEDGAPTVAAQTNLAALAQPHWASRPIEDRARFLIEAADRAIARLNGFALLLSSEMGKLLRDCAGEIRFADALLRDQCGRALRLLHDETRGAGPGRRVVQHRPLGVIAAIVPWNAPIILAVSKIAPALLSGNAVVVKPSPLAPLALTAFLEELAKHLPEPVLKVVNGGAATGAALIGSPGVGKVAFTGGSVVGLEVLRQASNRFLPCVMELGGNDPLIVLDDLAIDRDRIEAIVWATFLNAGQVCMAAKRLLVPEALASQFTDAYVSVARTLFRLGDPTADGVTMGPLITAAAQARAADLARESQGRGGIVIDLLPDGSRVSDEGYFLPPRLVTGLLPDAPLVGEEQFGPIVPLVTYRGEDEAIALANAGDLGLSASVWSSDPDRAWAVLDKIRCGFGMVNAHNRSGFSFDLPFGGVGASGFGREYGDEGLLEYSTTRSLHEPASIEGRGGGYPVVRALDTQYAPAS